MRYEKTHVKTSSLLELSERDNANTDPAGSDKCTELENAPECNAIILELGRTE